MRKFDAYYLPKRTFLFYEPATIIVGEKNIKVTSKKDNRTLFELPLDKLHISTEKELSWTILSDGKEQLVRLLFSDPAKVRNVALLAAATIIVGSLFKGAVSLGLVISFLLFRPWLKDRESSSSGQTDLTDYLMSTKYSEQIMNNGPSVDDMTKGTNRLLGGWREIASSAITTLISTIILTSILVMMGVFTPEQEGFKSGVKTSDHIIIAIYSIILFLYHSAIFRRIMVEYFKKQRKEQHQLGIWIFYSLLPLIILTLSLIICVISKRHLF